MSYQLPPKVIDPNTKPMRYHAMDKLSIAERTIADARAIEDLIFKGTEPDTVVFLRYDRSLNEFEYITGDHWNSCHRYVGTVPDLSKQKGES